MGNWSECNNCCKRGSRNVLREQKRLCKDMASDARETIENSSIYTRFEDLEEKVRTTIDASLEKLNFSKADDYEKIEKRIDSLEEKLTQLLASLEDIKTTPAKTNRKKKKYKRKEEAINNRAWV